MLYKVCLNKSISCSFHCFYSNWKKKANNPIYNWLPVPITVDYWEIKHALTEHSSYYIIWQWHSISWRLKAKMIKWIAIYENQVTPICCEVMMVSFIPQALSLCIVWSLWCRYSDSRHFSKVPKFSACQNIFESNIGRSYYPSFIVIQEE